MIPKPQGWSFTFEGRSGRRQAPLELVVVIGIEQVVLAVVLVVQDQLHLAQAIFQTAAVFERFTHGSVVPLAPVQKSFGQVSASIPLAAID